MTTICTDGVTMAADRLVTGNGLRHGTIDKLALAADGSVIGGVGTAFDLAAFVKWYDSDQTFPFDLSDNSEFLVLSPNGTVRCFNHIGRSFVASVPQAIGSGAGIAYGAMHTGASPRQAVEAACVYDHRSGGGAVSMSPRA